MALRQRLSHVIGLGENGVYPIVMAIHYTTFNGQKCAVITDPQMAFFAKI